MKYTHNNQPIQYKCILLYLSYTQYTILPIVPQVLELNIPWPYPKHSPKTYLRQAYNIPFVTVDRSIAPSHC